LERFLETIATHPFLTVAHGPDPNSISFLILKTGNIVMLLASLQRCSNDSDLGAPNDSQSAAPRDTKARNAEANPAQIDLIFTLQGITISEGEPLTAPYPGGQRNARPPSKCK
jgi:hypothetical protein